jgi:subtilisin family serine protease
MHQQRAVILALLMLTSSVSLFVINDDFKAISKENDNSYSLSEVDIYSFPSPGNPWIEDSLNIRVESGVEKIRVTVITWSLAELNLWQLRNGALDKQADAKNGEIFETYDPTSGEIDHRTFWMPADIFHKLPGIPGVISILDAQNNPQPYDTIPFERPDFEPESVRSGEIHGAIDAWEKGYTGEGMIVAVADTGVDFAHPDLNGTQARVEDSRSDWSGWPMMFDHNSMYSYLVNGNAYPQSNTWYADTSNLDYDNDSDGVLDISGFNISGIPSSKSGIYHLGEHPDSSLRSKVGADVPIIVIDEDISGLYETVYADMNVDGNFSGEKAIKPGSETTGIDTNGDNLWDISGGLVYWVSDGINGVPYGETYSIRHGYQNRIAGAGNLTLFMLDSGSHGTLCASAISAQGEVDDGRVIGMAPNATIASIGNHYSGGHSLDAWRWIAEGNDGKSETKYDQADIGSFSFGYSSIDESGADGYSLYLDWLTRVYNDNASYSVAIGNGGHGFGTTKVPGAAHGVFSVGAFSSRSSDSWGQNAPWSNRGPNVVGRMDPDIVSVGWSATGDLPLNLRNNANSAWSTWGGTSLATPIAAGLLALVAEAWQETQGEYPDSQTLRDFVLSTSDDRGYEPFIQGGGWFNASRAVSTLEGDNGSWWMSPAQWNSGTFQGKHRDANINYMFPGESQVVNLDFTNHANSDVLLRFTPTLFEPLAHEVIIWNSTGNGSSDGENDSWDGHQGDRPDLLIPLHIPDTEYALPEDTRQLRARATIEYSAFDENMDKNSEERVFLQIYRWSDDDGDGIYVEDFDNDSMVDSDDWTESSELDEVSYWWSNGPNAEVRVGNPFEDARDGIFLGVWNHNGDLSDEPVRIEIDWTAFGSADDQWISIPPTMVVNANSNDTIQMNITVPEDAESGLHQHGVLIESFHYQDGNASIISHRNWTLPVVTNVPWSGPFEITPNPLDGNVSNQTLYDEEWISGATRWNWRAESGDWRFLTIDWPEEWDTGGTVILDVDWDDNPYTDVDVLWLDETPHGYSSDDSDAYGDSTFTISSRSANNHAGSGKHNWGTYTGTSREVFTVPALAGTHQMVLHTALHGVSTNDNALNISVGYVAAEQDGFSQSVSDWSNGDGVDAVHVVSTVPMDVESVSAYGWTQPIYFDNETAYQDTSNNKMTSSWWHNFTVDDVTELSITMDAYESADLDLFLFYDENEDGQFTSGEEVSRSWTGTSSESIQLNEVEDGLYAVAVHGYSVSGEVQFWLDIAMVGGDKLNITDQIELLSSEINSIWPNGSETLAGNVPTSAHQINLAFERPDSAGLWHGEVEITLVGGIKLSLPYAYELLELEPYVEFSTPENLTQTNELLPIEIYAADIGIGFTLDDLNWYGMNNQTIIPTANSVEGIDTYLNYHNLTDIWNSGNHFAMPENISFREVWINSTIPESEQWHDYGVNITDRAGLYYQSWLSVNYDVTSPPLFIFGVPEITKNPYINLVIQTEPGASVYQDGYFIPGFDNYGFANWTVGLLPSQIGIDYSLDGILANYYLIPEENYFSITSVDAAGNSVSSSHMVIFDNQIPELDSVYIDDQNGFRYTTNDFYSVLNISSSIFGLNMSIDVKEWCLNITKEDSIIDEVLELCRTNENMPEILITNQSDLENTRNIPIQVNLSNISDGDYLVNIYLIDWAGNSAFEEFNLFLDRSIPIIDWTLSPSNNKELFDHRQVMNWASNEFSHVYFTHNGEQIEEWEAYGSESSITLQDKGLHEFCIIAYDSTEGQYNENILVDCQTYELNASIYSTNVVAPWNGGITTEDTLSAVLYRGPDQEIWWQNDAEEELFLITPGAQVVELYFTLKEGMNEFSIEIESLDEMHDYQLFITRDTIAPVLSFEQISIRNSTLNPVKNIEGNCEPGAYVMIWSVIESHEFICDASGIIDIEISVQDMVGSHVIQGTTTDAVNNRNSFSIEVINQNWIDWAIDDAQDQGPMLWYFLSTLFAVLILISITVIGRKSLKKKKLNNKNMISLEESFNEINELLNSPSESEIDWGVVNSDIPEAEELRSWKEPTRSIHSINQTDDEVIDLD